MAFSHIWGSASKSNIAIIQKFQNKILRIVADAPWYVSNGIIQNDLQIPAVKSVIEIVRNIVIEYHLIRIHSLVL